MTTVAWTYCRSCGAKIYWLKNDKTGKPAPIDAAPSVGGNIEIDLAAQTYRVVGKPELLRTPGYPHRHTNHFQTCISANVWRRHGGSGMRGSRKPRGRE